MPVRLRAASRGKFKELLYIYIYKGVMGEDRNATEGSTYLVTMRVTVPKRQEDSYIL
jgi:hypothetical protein